VQQQSLTISFIQSLDEIDPAAWNDCAGADNPFVSHEFLSALEHSGSVGPDTGWLPYHMLVRSCDPVNAPATTMANTPGSDRTIKACMPLYLKNHSYGEYVFDHGWADAFERAGGRYYPKLQASVPFTPAIGPRFLVNSASFPEETALLKSALADGLVKITEKMGLSSAHVTFLSDEDISVAKEENFLIRHDQQFHWHNDNYASFDDFLDQLSSRKRKQIRKERKTVASSDIHIETLTGRNITERHWDAFFRFYMDTGARKWGQPYLTREFFSEIGRTMNDHIILFMCTREGREIAAALNFLGSDTIYGRQWGCIEDHPCLHFEACYYRAIDYAIEHGIGTVEAGAQGPHKLARGYAPVKTTSVHYIAEPSFRDAVARFLEDERRGVSAEIDYLAGKTPFKKV